MGHAIIGFISSKYDNRPQMMMDFLSAISKI